MTKRNNRILVASGLLLLAFGVAAFDWRVSAIVMGGILTLSGLEII